MDELDFTIELNSPLSSRAEADLFAEADRRLRDLAQGHTDLTGAAINIRRPARGETDFLFEATVVAYGRPEHVAATTKESDAMTALKGALDGVVRQVRSRREKLGKPWERPGQGPVVREVEATLNPRPHLPEVRDTD